MTERVTLSDYHDGADLQMFEVKGMRITVAKVNGAFYAFDDTCTHLQCSLAEGTLDGSVVTCPCHGSQFDGLNRRSSRPRSCQRSPLSRSAMGPGSRSTASRRATDATSSSRSRARAFIRAVFVSASELATS